MEKPIKPLYFIKINLGSVWRIISPRNMHKVLPSTSGTTNKGYLSDIDYFTQEFGILPNKCIIQTNTWLK